MGDLATILNQLKNERARVEGELKRLDEAIKALTPVVGRNATVGYKRSRMSAAARRRIAAAQKARWAKFHANRKKVA